MGAAYFYHLTRQPLESTLPILLGRALDQNWRVFASTAYDIVAEKVSRYSAGIAYDDDYFSFAIGYSRLDPDFSTSTNDESINFSIGFRTIGGFQRTVDFGGEEN